MIIHAVSEEQKKMQAHHIVSGCICKNCVYYRKGVKYDNCKLNGGKIIHHTDHCPDFERKPTT